MKKITLLILTFIFGFILFQPLAYAVDPFEQVCRDNPDNSVCNTPRDADPLTGTDSIVPDIANIIAAIGGVIAVIIIMISGLKFITSSGDSKKLEEARNTIIYASVGIVVILFARIAVEFILRFI